MSIILITHNLGIVAQTCKKVLVMYKGEIVESGYVKDILKRPKHPYTIELLNSLPENNFGERINISNHMLKNTEYNSLDNKCAYYNRCQIRKEICLNKPELIKYKDDHSVKCWINKCM
jgi:oligopeptide/dipeptide ABC transporter ATP-binding protein